MSMWHWFLADTKGRDRRRAPSLASCDRNSSRWTQWKAAIPANPVLGIERRRGYASRRNPLKDLAPRPGLEPGTYGLTGGRSNRPQTGASASFAGGRFLIFSPEIRRFRLRIGVDPPTGYWKALGACLAPDHDLVGHPADRLAQLLRDRRPVSPGTLFSRSEPLRGRLFKVTAQIRHSRTCGAWPLTADREGCRGSWRRAQRQPRNLACTATRRSHRTALSVSWLVP